MKEKTINFLNAKSTETEALLRKAVRYREKLDKAKTSFAKDLYKKKLTKIVKKLDANIKLFSLVEQMQKLEAQPSVEESKE